MAEMVCPFCGFKADAEYTIQLHIEEHHTEDSPFATSNASSSGANGSSRKEASSSEESLDDLWTKCTRPNCGEYVLLSDVDEHIELHETLAAAESAEQRKDEQPPRSPNSSKRRSGSNYRDDVSNRDAHRSPQKHHKSRRSRSNDSRSGSHSLLEYFSGRSYHGPPRSTRPPPRTLEPRQPGRLGKRELGPHAFEKSMPTEVRRRLLNDALPRHIQRIGRDGRLYRGTSVDNETSGLVNILSDLCALDRSTEATYFCHPGVKHIAKLRCDGNFCGYWNIQVVLSYLHSLRERFEPLPNVLQIQETIEDAWDSGICSYGRVETGGVRGTRKWIGTHEALAFFTQVGVKVDALVFREEEGEGSAYAGQPAVLALLDHIEAYFISGLENARAHGTSHITALPPIYFQRFGHSMTIVGLERKHDGSRNLLVFDSSFATTDSMRRLLADQRSHATIDTLLRPYRRSDVSLSRWEEFEIIVPQAPKQVEAERAR